MPKFILSLNILFFLNISIPTWASSEEKLIEVKNHLFQCQLALPISRLSLDDNTKMLLWQIHQRRSEDINRASERRYGRAPRFIRSGGLQYSVVRYLRSTEENIVYLVKRKNQNYSLGFYPNEYELQQTIKELAIFSSKGILTSHPLSADTKNKTMLFPYFREVSVSDILATSLARGTNLIHFLSSESIKTVIQNYGKENLSKLQDRILLDIDSGKFILIPF